jgi:predicted DNA-binding WGR domain protein
VIELELDGTPGKFWRVEVRGTQHFVTFGARGSKGQTRLVELDSEEAARADAEKRAAGKRKEGYRAR